MLTELKKHKNLIVTIFIIISVTAITFKIIGNVAVLGGLLQKIYSLSTPFIYGTIIAYILNPFVRALETKGKRSRGAAIGITYTILLALLSLSIIYVVPSLIENI